MSYQQWAFCKQIQKLLFVGLEKLIESCYKCIKLLIRKKIFFLIVLIKFQKKIYAFYRFTITSIYVFNCVGKVIFLYYRYGLKYGNLNQIKTNSVVDGVLYNQFRICFNDINFTIYSNIRTKNKRMTIVKKDAF